MRVLVVEPERRPEVREIDDSLSVMQEIMGGYIQAVHLDDSVVLVCNEEGKFMDLPANRGLRGEAETIRQIGNTLYLAEVNGVRCTAIFNFFTRSNYVNDMSSLKSLKNFRKIF